MNSLGANASAEFDIGAVIVGGGYAVISVVGTAGNALVIYAVVTSKELQNSSTVFITNLAATDLMTCVVFPLLVVSRLALYRPYQETMCLVTLSVLHTTILVSVFSLASIALNRLIMILSPTRYYLTIFQRKGFAIWIATLWVIAISVAVLPPDVFGIGRLGYDHQFKVCRPDTSHETSDLYDALLILVLYPVPLLIILVSYITIFVKVMRHNRRMKKQTTSLSMSSSSGSGSDWRDRSKKENRRRFLVQLRITKNMFYVFLAFVLCVTPHAICNFTECPLEAYTRMIVSTNSMLNPIIYGFNHPHFRAAFSEIFKRG